MGVTEPRATRSLDSEGTTVSYATSLTDVPGWRRTGYVAPDPDPYPGDPSALAPAVLRDSASWTADLEHVWRTGVSAVRARWGLRAAELRRAGDRPRARYAASRERGLGLPRADVVRACGGRWRKVACACGTVAVPVGCDQPLLCDVCQRRLWRRWRKRMTVGLRDALAREQAAWARRGGRGLRPRCYLLTLTVAHSGSIVADRERLGAGWRRLYQTANARGWWSSYAAAYEVTPGRDGLGHVHMHVVLVSSWVPYAELHTAWRRAMRLADDEPHVLDIRNRLDDGRSVADADAASYVSKYVTKGVQPGEFTGQKAGELLVAFRGRRKVTTSRGFWRPTTRCDTCAARYRLVELPPGLLRHTPGACWRVLARHTLRGQRELDLGPDPPARSTRDD